MLRKIFGPEKESDIWRIRSNHELMDVRRQPDSIWEIRKGRLRWLWRVERIRSERTVKKVFKDIPEGKRSFGKPRKKWLDDVENDLKKMSVRGWRKMAKDRSAWKLILKKARVLHGQKGLLGGGEGERERESLHIRAMRFCTEVAEPTKWWSVVLSPVSDLHFWLALLSGDRDQMEPMG